MLQTLHWKKRVCNFQDRILEFWTNIENIQIGAFKILKLKDHELLFIELINNTILQVLNLFNKALSPLSVVKYRF